MVDGLVIELVITVRRGPPDDEVQTLELEPVRRGDQATRRPSQLRHRRGARRADGPGLRHWLRDRSPSWSPSVRPRWHGPRRVPRPSPGPSRRLRSGPSSAGACATRPGGCTTEEYRNLVVTMLATINTIPHDCRARAGGCTTEEYRTDPARLWPRPPNP